MVKLLYDFANTPQASRFPQHGWAENSQGLKVLWLPFVEVVDRSQLIRSHKGLREALPTSHQLGPLHFKSTLTKLATVLRELHEVIRKACEDPMNFDRGASAEAAATGHRAREMTPLFFDLASVYLRRLADLLATASRPVLFENWESAPTRFEALLDDNLDFGAFQPICDTDLLRQTLSEHCGWFWSLRQRTASKDQVKTVRIVTGGRCVFAEDDQSNGSPGGFEITFESRRSQTLKAIVEDFCQLLDGLHRTVQWGEGYVQGDAFSAIGVGEDPTGFWPKI